MILLLSASAWACPVCGAPGATNETAYLAGTALLSLLPLAFMAGVGVWIYRTVNRSQAEAGPDTGPV